MSYNPLAGGAAPSAIVPSDLPAVGAITLLTDLTTSVTAIRDSAETRLDTVEAAVNSLRTSLLAAKVIT